MSLAIISANLKCLETLPIMVSAKFSAHIQKIFFKKLTIICSVLLKPSSTDIPSLWNKLGAVTTEAETSALLNNLFETENLNFDLLGPSVELEIIGQRLTGQSLNLEALTREAVDKLSSTLTSLEELQFLESVTFSMRQPLFLPNFKAVSSVFPKSLQQSRKELAAEAINKLPEDGVTASSFPEFLDASTLEGLINEILEDTGNLETFPAYLKPMLANTTFPKEANFSWTDQISWSDLLKEIIVHRTYFSLNDCDRSFIRVSLRQLKNRKHKDGFKDRLQQFISYLPLFLVKYNHGPNPILDRNFYRPTAYQLTFDLA